MHRADQAPRAGYSGDACAARPGNCSPPRSTRSAASSRLIRSNPPARAVPGGRPCLGRGGMAGKCTGYSAGWTVARGGRLFSAARVKPTGWWTGKTDTVTALMADLAVGLGLLRVARMIGRSWPNGTRRTSCGSSLTLRSLTGRVRGATGYPARVLNAEAWGIRRRAAGPDHLSMRQPPLSRVCRGAARSINAHCRGIKGSRRHLWSVDALGAQGRFERDR